MIQALAWLITKFSVPLYILSAIAKQNDFGLIIC
jgi:hypothetical protein